VEDFIFFLRYHLSSCMHKNYREILKWVVDLMPHNKSMVKPRIKPKNIVTQTTLSFIGLFLTGSGSRPRF